MPISLGSKAPDFTLKTQTAEGIKDVRLSNNFGKKHTILLFFPLAYTGVCTQEMCDQTGGLAGYAQLGAELIGISVDSPFTQEAWAKANRIGVTLVSDLNKETTKAYGVLFPMLAGIGDTSARAVFLIGKDGVVKYVEQTRTPKDLPDFAALKTALAAEVIRGFFPDGPPRQDPVGGTPETYLWQLKQLRPAIRGVSSSQKRLPKKGTKQFARGPLGKVCRNSKVHPLVSYACVMAWGASRMDNYRDTIERSSIKNLTKLIRRLRSSRRSRRDDFAATQAACQNISGLNVSFYTKLLFFFRAGSDAYILDQWTAKSAVLLFPDCGVSLTSAGLPKPDTTPEAYDAFCQTIENLARRLGPPWTNGEEVERTLFDNPKGEWRKHLKVMFPN
jgi:peroxiredoxin